LIHAWRLVRLEHGGKEEAFSGEGARLFGGRWNSPGVSVVYTSANLSLAVLETLVHADRRRFERTYLSYKVSLPEEGVLALDLAALPKDFRERPVSGPARRIGDAWVREGASVALAVPSVIIPSERNYLLNPAHPDFSRVVIGEAAVFRMDERLGPRGAE